MDSRQKNKDFYKGRKVFITGHTGFKGAWMSCVLRYLDADVVGYSLPPEKESLYEQLEDEKPIKSVIGSLEDYEHMLKVIKSFQPEIVIHLAAFGFMNECYNDPKKAYSTNVLGTVNLLEAIRECASVKSVIIVSTDKVYLNKDDGTLFSEEDVLGGTSPYSCSKTCMELIVKDYYETYFKPLDRKIGIGVVRASNVLAGGDHIPTRLIPSILTSLDKGIPVELRNPCQIRPWQSVLDALDGYLSVARFLIDNPEDYSGAWNIGPTEDGMKSVGWVFDKISSYFLGLKKEEAPCFSVRESQFLGLDITKSISRLDWKPSMPIEKVIKFLVDFYKGQKEGKKAYMLCYEQIEEYYGGLVNEVE